MTPLLPATIPALARHLLIASASAIVGLMPAGVATAQQPAAPAAAKPTTPTPPTATTPPPAAMPAAPGQPEDVQRTIDKLKQSAPAANPALPVPAVPGAAVTAARPVQPAPAAPVVAETAAPITGRLQREGTFLASRRGRVIKAPSGEWQYHFDTGPDNRVDAPMALMPCLNLQAIEKLAERGGEALSFSLSGQVFVYKGRNFLLPTLYTVNRRGDVTPAQ